MTLTGDNRYDDGTMRVLEADTGGMIRQTCLQSLLSPLLVSIRGSTEETLGYWWRLEECLVGTTVTRGDVMRDIAKLLGARMKRQRRIHEFFPVWEGTLDVPFGFVRVIKTRYGYRDVRYTLELFQKSYEGRILLSRKESEREEVETLAGQVMGWLNWGVCVECGKLHPFTDWFGAGLFCSDARVEENDVMEDGDEEL